MLAAAIRPRVDVERGDPMQIASMPAPLAAAASSAAQTGAAAAAQARQAAVASAQRARSDGDGDHGVEPAGGAKAPPTGTGRLFNASA
jgi:hypothetical protein